MRNIIIYKNWNLTRVIGLILGTFFLGDFFATGNFLGLMFGGMVLFQVIMNVGCFAGSCTTPMDPKRSVSTEEDADLVEVEVVNSEQ